MLLGCAGETGPTAVQALNAALAGGAVPDTWAPNGSSVRCVLRALPAPADTAALLLLHRQTPCCAESPNMFRLSKC